MTGKTLDKLVADGITKPLQMRDTGYNPDPRKKPRIAATEFQAVQFMPAFVLPQILLCGLFVPRETLPSVLEAVSNVLPLSYAVDAMTLTTGVASRPSEVRAGVSRGSR